MSVLYFSSGEEVARPIVSIAEDYPASFELEEHKHRRAQFLYAASGVMAVSTPYGSWVAPPERAIWIPGEVPHAVHMVGTVEARSVLIEPAACPSRGSSCQVVGVSSILRELLKSAAKLPVEYDEAGRDGLLMRLLLTEIDRAPLIPLSVPFPTHSKLAAKCHAFLDAPNVRVTIDQWADSLVLNRRKFTRIFRSETGMSFAEWKQQACLSVALQRMAAGASVTVVALDLGYDSPQNFSTMFKRVIGVSPSQYRSPNRE